MDMKLHLSIEDWLKKLDLLVYRYLFKDYEGVESLLWMTERDLNNLGIRNGGHRARLGSSIAILRDKYEKNERFLTPEKNILQANGSRSNFSVSPIRPLQMDESHAGVRSWPSTRPSTSHSTKHSSPRSSIENYSGTESTAEDLKKALEKELSLDSSDLRSHAWYHGTILRQRAEELVSHEGDFLVRDCISQPGDFVITCCWGGVSLHFRIKKVILQPDTVYEKIQYCFEKDSFDSIRDFVTNYVGSKCPLSAASGVVIRRPVNRIMPLSYYASRYGVQCQIHYVAKALEKIPSFEENGNTNTEKQNHSQASSVQFSMTGQYKSNAIIPQSATIHKNQSLNQVNNLVRMGSDPALSPNMERRAFERRPNSGLFNSEAMSALNVATEEKPPPKPSRVPSKRFVRKPVIVRKHRKLSEHENTDMPSTKLIPTLNDESKAHNLYQRQVSETRFSFLDRPSGNSTPDTDSATMQFSLPKMANIRTYEPQKFMTPFLASENLPLEGAVLARVRHLLLSVNPKTLACHLTRMDLETTKQFEQVDLGLGVVSGLELLLLPQGEQMQKDLLERTQSLKLFVAVLILTTPEADEQVHVLNKWIEIAIETKTVLGNLFGFTALMLGLTLPEILGLHSTWLSLRHLHTENAFTFETKLRPAFKQLHNASGFEAPNICLPYSLSILLILQQYISVIHAIQEESVPSELLHFDLPGIDVGNDFGLQLLANHLETGRYMMQGIQVFKENGQRSLQCVVFDDLILDMFNTEFHLRLMWGFRGSVVSSDQRHQIFQKVVHSLYNKCSASRN